jgi:hypothetical protein
MGQRGVKGRLVDVVSQYGTKKGDRIVLDRKNIDELLNGLDRLRKDLTEIKDKGGLVVIEDNGRQITVYRVNSFDRKKSNRVYDTSC